MPNLREVDVVLVGAGIMSATLGSLLKELNPDVTMVMLERFHDVALESSAPMNNAGTGHAAYCELNYTPQNKDGSVAIGKATAINASFEESLQFWSYLVERGAFPAPPNFINPVPHISFVWGEENVRFLKARHEAMRKHHLFEEMEYSEDAGVLETWMPLVMKQRDGTQKIAATRIKHGTDVDFGSVTRQLVDLLKKSQGFELFTGCRAQTIQKQGDGRWIIRARNSKDATTQTFLSKFVFLGAGGGALKLLNHSGIPESKGYGGFPVTGQWLVCTNPDVVKQHAAKVYGKASIGAPPMSVPHLDTRIVNGKKSLLFGPYAGFSTRFLKQGSYWDLPSSLNLLNLAPMLQAGLDNLPLTKYLIGEVFQSAESRVASLRNYFPTVRMEDWELDIAGQRVQIIKKDPVTGRGKLEFGTEVICAKDGSLAALLGASPGASTAVSAMLQVLERCFPDKVKSSWAEKLREIIPSYGQSLEKDSALLRAVRERTLKCLEIEKQS